MPHKRIDDKVSTSEPSIRVLSHRMDRMPPAPDTPIHVQLAVDGERWAGYTFTLSYTRGELVSLKVDREPDAEPLGRVTLQQVPLGALNRVAPRLTESFLGSWESQDRPNIAELRAVFPEIEQWWDATADQSTPSKEDVELARLSKHYVELGGQRGWRRKLAEKSHWSEGSVQTMISRARKRGFLTTVPRGQYGGRLTPKARMILGEITEAQMKEWAAETTHTRKGNR